MRASRENEIGDGTRRPDSAMHHVLREMDAALGPCRADLFPTYDYKAAGMAEHDKATAN